MKERALLASFVPFRLFLWPDDPALGGAGGGAPDDPPPPRGVPGAWWCVLGGSVLEAEDAAAE